MVENLLVVEKCSISNAIRPKRALQNREAKRIYEREELKLFLDFDKINKNFIEDLFSPYTPNINVYGLYLKAWTDLANWYLEYGNLKFATIDQHWFADNYGS